jgi:hypothetical protein
VLKNGSEPLRGEEARRAAHTDYERHFREWFREQTPAVQDILRGQGIDKPEPYDAPRWRAEHDIKHEFSDPADFAVDPFDPRIPIVDFGCDELTDYCDHFASALIWATRGKPDIYDMGVRANVLLTVMQPEALRGMKMPLPKKMVAELRNALAGRDPLETGRFFWLAFDWVRKCGSLLQLGKRTFSMIYALRPDLIDAATCAVIGELDNKSRQAANKPVQEFRDTFSGINSLPMRGNETRKRCKRAQLNNH